MVFRFKLDLYALINRLSVQLEGSLSAFESYVVLFVDVCNRIFKEGCIMRKFLRA